MNKKKKDTSELARLHTLEELRLMRDVARRENDIALAVKYATAIDIKHGFYK